MIVPLPIRRIPAATLPSAQRIKSWQSARSFLSDRPLPPRTVAPIADENILPGGGMQLPRVMNLPLGVVRVDRR